MQFCPKCGAILVQKRTKFGCPRCSYSSKDKIKIETSEKIEEHKGITVIKENEGEVLPLVDRDCPECGNKKAYFWTKQTRSSDESETKFFKCKKCRHTWRDYR